MRSVRQLLAVAKKSVSSVRVSAPGTRLVTSRPTPITTSAMHSGTFFVPYDRYERIQAEVEAERDRAERESSSYPHHSHQTHSKSELEWQRIRNEKREKEIERNKEEREKRRQALQEQFERRPYASQNPMLK